MTERGSRTARPFLPVLSGCLPAVGKDGLRIISLTGESAFRPGFGGVVSFEAALWCPAVSGHEVLRRQDWRCPRGSRCRGEMAPGGPFQSVS